MCHSINIVRTKVSQWGHVTDLVNFFFNLACLSTNCIGLQLWGLSAHVVVVVVV